MFFLHRSHSKALAGSCLFLEIGSVVTSLEDSTDGNFFLFRKCSCLFSQIASVVTSFEEFSDWEVLLFKESYFLLWFLLAWEGLIFFLYLSISILVVPFVSREKEKFPAVTLMLNVRPLVSSAWLNSRHWVRSSDSLVIFTGESDINEVGVQVFYITPDISIWIMNVFWNLRNIWLSAVMRGEYST